MKKYLLVLLIFFCNNHSYAQKGIEKLTVHKIDSLQHIHVDTLLYYDSYCGECEIKGNTHNCYFKSGYILDDNLIIYQQHGKFYVLIFDCYNSGSKRQLINCESLPYFLTIIPALKAQDRFFKDQRKKNLFPHSSISDGGFEDAEIIINRKKQYVSMAESEKTNFRDTDNTHYWVNKEIKLLKLISEDITIKKDN